MRKNFEILKQQHQDMIKAYCQVCGSSWTMLEACAKAVKLPAPRYYVTPKQAHMVISPMMRGDFEMVNLMPYLKRRMYYALFHEVEKMTMERAFIGKSLWYIMQFAVTRPAPEFFMKPQTLYYTRLLLKQGHIDENGQRKHIEPKIKKNNKKKKKKLGWM